MQKVHVLMRKEDLDPARLSGKVVVVIDVLFATSTIVAAFEHGVADVVPAADPDAARAAARGMEDGSYLLAGEHNMAPIEGFATYAPLALTREPLAGRRLIYSTTNGTVALYRARGADQVYAGALRNGAAVAAHIRRHHPEETVLLVCAGSGGEFNLEDFYGAGYLVDRLLAGEAHRWQVSDAGVAACALYRHQADAPAECLAASWLGTLLREIGSGDELRFAAMPGACSAVPVLEGDRLVSAAS